MTCEILVFSSRLLTTVSFAVCVGTSDTYDPEAADSLFKPAIGSPHSVGQNRCVQFPLKMSINDKHHLCTVLVGGLWSSKKGEKTMKAKGGDLLLMQRVISSCLG
jgi:hypothetical protein